MSQEQQIQHEFNMPSSSTQQEVTGSQRKDESTGNRNEQGGNEHERSPASPHQSIVIPHPSIVIPPPIQCHPPPIHCHPPTYPLFLQHPHPSIVLSRSPPPSGCLFTLLSLFLQMKSKKMALFTRNEIMDLFFWGGGGAKKSFEN